MAGLELGTSVDSDRLPADEADRLRELVEQADLETLSRRSPLRGKGADRFQYDLVISDEAGRHEVTASEDAAPSELRALVDFLLERAGKEP
jgi:hypothetical protein